MTVPSSFGDQVAVVAAGISLVSAAVSILAVYIPWRNTRDAEMFKQAILAIERSHGVLTSAMQGDGSPVADRVNWLTAARHIESFKALRNSLKTKLYRRLCQEHEEYWRHEFYLCLLNRNRVLHPAYFQNGQIEPRSAIVLFGFASWPHARQDPIDLADYEAIFKESDLLKGNYGLQQYLAQFPEFSGARAK